jgi:hypothetical protein
VELLFNLLWLALSLTLCGSWLIRRKCSGDGTLRVSTTVQIVTLAVLIVILLPVVSLTDDLQACTTPAEAEHLIRRDVTPANGTHPFHAASIVEAALLSFHDASRLQTLAYLSPVTKVEAPGGDPLSIVGNRPPPAE